MADGPEEARGLPLLLAERRPQGEAVAHLCRGFTCSAPITSFEDLKAALARTEV
jgi:uncharacterized protein YyaL (SSP411 family)